MSIQGVEYCIVISYAGLFSTTFHKNIRIFSSTLSRFYILTYRKGADAVPVKIVMKTLFSLSACLVPKYIGGLSKSFACSLRSFVLLLLLGMATACGPQNYEQAAKEFLQTIDAERVVATFTDEKYHCVFYIEQEDLGFMTEAGDKYWNLLKYDLKTKKTSKILRDDSKKLIDTELADKGSGFITLDFRAAHGSALCFSSYVDMGFEDVAMYDIDENKWHYLGCYQSPEISMGSTRVICASNLEEFDYGFASFFGPLRWTKEFDYQGKVLSNTVWDNVARKNYDGYEMAELEDADYINDKIRENFISHLQEQSIRSIDLLNELKQNRMRCDEKYMGKTLLIDIGKIYRITYAESEWRGSPYKYVLLTAPMTQLRCFSNDEAMATLSAGDGVLLIGRYKSSTEYDITLFDCQCASNQTLQPFHDAYMRLLRDARDQYEY